MINLLKKVHIHPLFWLIIAMGVITGRFKEVVMLLVIVLIHEMGHVWMAHRFGWKILKIELLPFGGAAVLEPKGIPPAREECFIVLWGPAQHIWMIALSYGLYHFSDVWLYQDHQLFVSHNIAILLFNLIPIHPLDGGRLIQLLFYKLVPYKQAIKLSFVTSSIFLFSGFLFVVFYSMQLNLIMIFSFLLLTLILEYKQREYRFIRFLMAKKEDYTSNHAVPILVEKQATIKTVVEKIKKNAVHTVVVKDGTNQTTFSLQALLDVYFREGGHVPLHTIPKS
ncbi:M50 family metallopeptidase [Shouchella sp. JSM 1781072]|uniref:M50 family metallopeptidase n=1 Tax=Shouchella sp. JSM 1781072 TaxID=3344581 RepID=UPI0035C08063